MPDRVRSSEPVSLITVSYQVRVLVRSSEPVSLIIVSYQVRVRVRSSEPVSQNVSVGFDFRGVFHGGANRVGNKNHFDLYSQSKRNFSGLFLRKNIEKFHWLRLKIENRNRNSTHCT